MGLFCEKVGRVLTGYPVNLMIAVYGNAGTTYEFYLKKMTKLAKKEIGVRSLPYTKSIR